MERKQGGDTPAIEEITTMYRLSKSRIISGLQCHKRLWLQIHKPDTAEMATSSLQSISFGNEVGDIARQMYPDGVLVGNHEDISGSIKRTTSIIESKSSTAMFEATFSSSGVVILADVIEQGANGLRLIEVKSSTAVKEYQVTDASVQAWVMTGAGHHPEAVLLRHINSDFVYPGGNDYRGIFTDVDVTSRVDEIAANIPIWMTHFKEMLSRDEPVIAVGSQCGDPFQCEFQNYCKKDLPPEPEYPVSILPRATKIESELKSAGYEDLRDVPEHLLENSTHLRIWRATKSGIPVIDPQAGKELRAMPYPRYYLDFEGINFAIPIWVGTKPYQQVAFQFSCHIDHGNGNLDHISFLHSDITPPMIPFLEALFNAVGEDGPVFVYNKAYEKTVLTRLGEMRPEHAARIEGINKRIVDLLPIARAHYYHPAMKGSWSLKAVLPTISPEHDYENLEEVADGGAAQEAFMEIISATTTPERRDVLKKHLTTYCGRDTFALVLLVRLFEG